MTETSPAVSVVTLNLRNGRAEDGPNSWRNRRAWVPAYLRDLGSDVLGLQEAFLDQVEDIEAELTDYVRVGVGRDDGVGIGEFCPIFFRAGRWGLVDCGTFWFSDTPNVPGSRMREASLPRICTWVVLRDLDFDRRIRIGNLHLDHASEAARMRSVGMLAERVAEWKRQSPVVIMGDFNAGEGSPEIRALLGDARAGLLDTFRGVHPHAADVATYHGFRGGVNGEKIDYILATRDIPVLDAAILRDAVDGAYPSDHYAVTTRLALKG